MNIEVLKCKDCGRLSISVDDTRQDTESAAGNGHGDSKCSGSWTVQVRTQYEAPVQGLNTARVANRQAGHRQAANNG